MENLSKEARILGQKREDFFAEFQSHPISSKKTEFFIEAEDEALKLSDLSITSQRRSPNMCAQFNSSHGKSSTVERRGKLLPEFISPWEDTTGFAGKTETSFLLKELDTLRTKNKKLQDELLEKDKELKTIKLDLELQERATEAKIAEKIAGPEQTRGNNDYQCLYLSTSSSNTTYCFSSFRAILPHSRCMEVVAHSPQLETCTLLEKSVLLAVNEFFF